MIYNDIAAIGGETTGSVIVSNDQTIVEIDLGDSDRLHELAAKYHHQRVIIEGAAVLVEGIEIPNRTVIDVRSIFGTTEVEALADSLNAIDPNDSLGLLAKLDNFDLG